VDIGTISLILLAAMFLLLAIGMPLGFASAALALLVLLLKFGPDQLFSTFGTGILDILAKRIYDILKNFVLISVPLFIFMAALLERSGIARDMYDSLNYWLSRTRGGIALVTSIMAIIMAAMSGIIGGEVVLLGLIALPQMLRLGYNQKLAIGTICASGSLGTMIPPSVVLIIYGLITETSVKDLFTAAFLPGFMLGGFYIIYIIVRTQLNPEQAPLPPPRPDDPTPGEKTLLFGTLLLMIAGAAAAVLLLRAGVVHGMGQADVAEGEDPITLVDRSAIIWLAAIAAVAAGALMFVVGRERRSLAWKEGKGLVAPLLVVGVVLGSIYAGVTGVTEAAAMGCVAVALLTAIRGEMSWALLREALMRTFKSTGTIIWVTFGATALAGAYTIAGGPTYVANLIVGADLPTMGVILVMMVIFLILGALMDWVGIVLLVMPVFLPIVLKLPVEEIGYFGTLPAGLVAVWYGVTFCMNMQVSFLSPPFAPAAFYLKSVAPPQISLTAIFASFFPFICIQLLALAVMLAWPGIVGVFLAN
jgi:TRAP-type mannitol/chloroaromatic compound transport system permease large subunit